MIRPPQDIATIRHLADLIKNKPSNVYTIAAFFHKIQKKYYAKIIYALSVLKFSSYSELSTLLNLGDMSQIRRCIDSFIEDGTVTILKKQTEEYQIVTTFWKKQYPTSPFLPEFFILTNDWSSIAKSLEEYFMKFFTSNEMSLILRRSRSYDYHHDTVKHQIKIQKRRIKDSIGICQVEGCGKLIPKNSRKGYDYQIYGSMMVCNNCRNKATVEQIRKWRTKKV